MGSVDEAPALLQEGRMPTERKKAQPESSDEHTLDLPWRDEDITTEEDLERNTYSVERSRREREESAPGPAKK